MLLSHRRKQHLLIMQSLSALIFVATLSSVRAFSVLPSHAASTTFPPVGPKTVMRNDMLVMPFQGRPKACVHLSTACSLHGVSGKVVPQLLAGLRSSSQYTRVTMNMAQTQPLTDGKGAESQDPKWSELASWAKESGIEWQKWVVGEVDGGLRGAVATANLGLEEIIVTAPPEATIMIRASDPCPFPSSFLSAEYWDEMSGFWNLRMALRLIYEKRRGEDSPFAPYMKVLPETYTTPMCFSDEEIEELQWAPFIEDVNVERNYFAYEWKRLQKAMKNPPSKEELFWGLSCAGTRSFTADFGEDELNGELMCPIADMVNHDFRAKPAFRWNPDAGEFELFAPVPFRRGEQVCISYGDVNNEHLLHYYGFIPGVNGHDHFTVTEKELLLALPKEEQTDQVLMEGRIGALRLLMDGGGIDLLSCPLAELAEDSLLSQGDGSEIKVFPDVGGVGALLMYARALTLSGKDVERGTTAMARQLQGGRSLYPENEARAQALVVAVLRKQQEAMPTSLEEDRALLQEAESGTLKYSGNLDHYTLALRYRAGRKQLVEAALSQLKA